MRPGLNLAKRAYIPLHATEQEILPEFRMFRMAGRIRRSARFPGERIERSTELLTPRDGQQSEHCGTTRERFGDLFVAEQILRPRQEILPASEG